MAITLPGSTGLSLPDARDASRLTSAGCGHSATTDRRVEDGAGEAAVTTEVREAPARGFGKVFKAAQERGSFSQGRGSDSGTQGSPWVT